MGGPWRAGAKQKFATAADQWHGDRNRKVSTFEAILPEKNDVAPETYIE